MKKKHQTLLLVFSALLLIGATVLGTLAYLTSKDEVINTFTVGNIEISLDEAKVDEYGVPVDGADRVKENEYKLIPGHTYVKDPTVHVKANSEASWLFIKVNNPIESIEDSNNTIASQIAENGWKEMLVESPEENTKIYYKQIEATDDATVDYKIFDDFTVTSSIGISDLESAEGKSVTINAYAIQYDGFATVGEAGEQFGFKLLVLPEGWDELIAATEDGTYAEKYPAGTEITLPLADGSSAVFVVAGIDHDDLADGSGKAKLSLITKTSLFTRQMNSTETISGGWEATELRAYLQGEYFNTMIPAAVKDYIKAVTKLSRTSSGTNQTTEDTIWIPSAAEFGDTNRTDGTSYDAAYLNTAKNMTATAYWLRSARDTTWFRFYHPRYSLTTNQGGAANSNYKVICGFCIGD